MRSIIDNDVKSFGCNTISNLREESKIRLVPLKNVNAFAWIKAMWKFNINAGDSSEWKIIPP